MNRENMNEMDQEALNLTEEQRKRKQAIWRWSIIFGSALVLAVIITFFVCGGAAKNAEVADTTPTTVVTEPVTEPVVTIPETTEPIKEPEPTKKPDKKPTTTKPATTEPVKKPETAPDWTYDKNLTAAKNIFNYLTDKLGYSKAAACGIVANIDVETGGHFTPKAGNPKQCYGLIQWQGGRLTNLKSWCDKNGKDYHSIQGQLDFMDWELKNTNTYGTYEKLLECKQSKKGAYKAGFNFCYWYERPNNKKNASKYRGNLAKKYYQEFVLGEV